LIYSPDCPPPKKSRSMLEEVPSLLDHFLFVGGTEMGRR
jgi:hypothetical protein